VEKECNPDQGFDQLDRQPVTYMDVFVDDFWSIGQDTPMKQLANQSCMLMHNIDKIFCPLDEQDDPCCKESISMSKQDK
jgi:hypothetical protein